MLYAAACSRRGPLNKHGAVPVALHYPVLHSVRCFTPLPVLLCATRLQECPQSLVVNPPHSANCIPASPSALLLQAAPAISSQCYARFFYKPPATIIFVYPRLSVYCLRVYPQCVHGLRTTVLLALPGRVVCTARLYEEGAVTTGQCMHQVTSPRCQQEYIVVMLRSN